MPIRQPHSSTRIADEARTIGTGPHGALVENYVQSHVVPFARDIALPLDHIHDVTDAMVAAGVLRKVVDASIHHDDEATRRSAGSRIAALLADVGTWEQDLNANYVNEGLDHVARAHYFNGLLADGPILDARLVQATNNDRRRRVQPLVRHDIVSRSINLESVVIGAADTAATLRLSDDEGEKKFAALSARWFYWPTLLDMGFDPLAAEVDSLIIQHDGSYEAEDLKGAQEALRGIDQDIVEDVASNLFHGTAVEPAANLVKLVEPGSIGYTNMLKGYYNSGKSFISTRVKSEPGLAHKRYLKRTEGKDPDNIMDVVGITVVAEDESHMRDLFAQVLARVDGDDSIQLQPSTSKPHAITITGSSDFITRNASSLGEREYNRAEKDYTIIKFTALVEVHGRTVPVEVQFSDEDTHEDSRRGPAARSQKGQEITDQDRALDAVHITAIGQRMASFGSYKLNSQSFGNIPDLNQLIIQPKGEFGAALTS